MECLILVTVNPWDSRLDPDSFTAQKKCLWFPEVLSSLNIWGGGYGLKK